VRRKGSVGTGLAALVFAACSLLLGSGLTRGTSALFNGETQNAGSTFADGWIGAAASPAATASGNDVMLTWTPGTHGPVTGQQLHSVDNGTNSNCTGAAYALLATMAAASTASYTDASRATSSNNGNWFCFKIVSTSATAWTAEAPVAALQIGLAATGVATGNASSRCTSSPAPVAGVMDCNDTITVTFNQKPNLATSGTIKVCAWTVTKTIVIGDTAVGNCTAAVDPYSIGVIGAGNITADARYTSSTFTLSAAAPWTLSIVLKGSNAAPPGVAGPLALTPASSIKSAMTTHQATICTSSSSTCRPTTGTAF
jgi:hypothetical protein